MNKFAHEVMTAPTGHTHIFSVGQAGYIIKTHTGSLLGIDLYLSDCVERFEGNTGFKRLLPKLLFPDELQFDAVICTHPHLDHFDIDAVPYFLSNGQTKLYCSVDCAKHIKRLNLEYYRQNIAYVEPKSSYVLGDMRIDFVSCDHGVAAPDAVGVVVHTGGKVIYEAGDTCLQLDILREIPCAVDVLIAPINGAFGNMTEEDCAILSERLCPKITIPCHYGMFASHHGDAGKFYDIMTAKGLPFMLMQQGEKYTL